MCGRTTPYKIKLNVFALRIHLEFNRYKLAGTMGSKATPRDVMTVTRVTKGSHDGI